MSLTLRGKVYNIAKEYLYLSIIVVFLGIVGVLLPSMYGGNMDSAQAGSSALPVISTDAKTKLLLVDSVYYLAFSSSTANGDYNIYIVTSTDGSVSSWTDPQMVFEGVKSSMSDSANSDNGLFAFEYNSFGSYFGVTAFASSTFGGGGTNEAWFTSSTNGSSWSATTTVASSLPSGDGDRQIYMDFSSEEELVAVSLLASADNFKFYYSTNQGSSWSSSGALTTQAGIFPVSLGFGISGSGASRRFHTAYYDTETNFDIVYASTTDNVGTSWTTTTVASNVFFDFSPGPGNLGYAYLNSFALDDNGLPGVVYYKYTDISGSGPYPSTSSIYYTKKGSDGSWSTPEEVASDIAITITADTAYEPVSLSFFNTDDPIIFGVGSSLYPVTLVNTSSVWNTIYTGGTAVGDYSEVSSVYDTTNQLWAGSYVTAAGQLSFITNSLLIPLASAPSNLATSTVANSQIGLTWDAVSGATNYELYRDIVSSFTNTTIIVTAGTSYSDTGLTPSTTYYYKVATVNAAGTSTPSAYISVTTPNLPVVDTDAKTKLLWVDGVYYLAFSSSSADGVYDVYLTTSTDGFWSQPVEVFTGVWGKEDGDTPADLVQGIFAFEYNSTSSYFGLAAFATGTSRMDFTTSSDGSSWSATTTVTSDLTDVKNNARSVYMSFADDDGYVVLAYEDEINSVYQIATSTNGVSWSTSTIAREDTLLGVGITGSDDSRVLHLSYINDSDNIIYASSTDSGSNWTTTTAVSTPGAPGYVAVSFAVDDNGLPGFSYSRVDSFVGSDAVTTLLYTKKSSDGSWSSATTVESSIETVITGSSFPGALTFFNTDDPIIAYYSDSFYPYWAVNTSTSFVSTSFVGGSAIDETSKIGLAYDTTDEEVAIAYVSGGQLYFATSSLALPNAVPTATMGGTPSQTTVGIVTATSTVADTNSEVTNLIVEHSVDNSTWVSSTLATVTDTEGIDDVTTSTGNIADIDTDSDGSVVLTVIQWNVEADLPDTDDTEVWLRFTPNDGTDNGTTVTSPSFAIDTKDPTAPGPLTLTSTSTTSFVFAYGTTTTDNGFSEYKIFYKAGASGVATSDTAITSSTDTNLGSKTFASDTTSTVSGLSVNTQYVFNIWAYDSWGNTTSGTTELAFYTLADVAGTPTVGGVVNTSSSLDIVFGEDTNPAATVYAIYESATGLYVAGDNGLDSATAVWQTTSTWSNPTITGLSANTEHTFLVIARNGDEFNSASTTASAVYTLASTPTAPTVTAGSATTLNVTVVDDGATTYAVKVVTGATTKYLQADGTIGDSAVWLTYAQLGSGSATSTTGLTANTSYTVSVASKNGDGTATAYTAASAVYTLTTAPTAPTVTATSATTLSVTTTDDGATTYAVKVVTGATTKYLQADGTIGDSAVWLTYAQLGSGSATSTTGLTANTSYTVSVSGKNGDGTATAYTAASALYTNSTAPSTPSAVSTGQTTMTVTWTANTNGTGTVYELYNVTTLASVATTTEVSYAVTGLTTATSYVFKVRAQYLSDTDTYSSYSFNSTAVSTDAAASTPSSSGSTSPPPPPPPPPATSAPATVNITVTPNSPQSVSVGNVSHTVTAGTPASSGAVTITIQSDPVTITLKPGEEELVDTDSDSKDDLFVRLDSVDGDNISLTIAAIDDLEFSINKALSTTDKQEVTLYFNSPDATQIAISNESDFSGVSFQTYTATAPWTLTEGDGTKTVYVKFRTASGGTRSVSDTIILTGQGTDQVVENVECSLTKQKAYKHSSSPAVYYITSDCTKRAFSKESIFFTYFDSWSDVLPTSKNKLDSIPNDVLGFMPLGPNYDPKYGAIVKIISSPRVYLLLNTEKYWITSPTVFNALKYAWNWIEDVDDRLLDKYTTGSEIIYTDHHPNYTLIKYENDPNIYRLEPASSEDPEGKQVKRWIAGEEAFNSLNFRWDRIVTISDTEVYETGDDLVSTDTTNTTVEEVSTKYTFTSFLSIGSTGEEVKQLQIRLQELGFLDNDITPTENFDQATKESVIKLQQEHNLTPVEGYVGPGTRGVLNGL